MSTTIQEMEKMVEEIADLRMKESQASAAKKAATEALEAAELRMLTTLNGEGLTSYRGSMGLVSLSYRTSVKTPKTDEDRQKFFDYLKERGLYDKLISVNSQTLNSFYKSELEAALESGKDGCEIPGINEVSVQEILSFRKA
jgi:ATP-dependent protease HslVU (ClpYQ) ATPase subunit